MPDVDAIRAESYLAPETLVQLTPFELRAKMIVEGVMSGMQDLVISGESTATSLADGVQYPKLIRSVPTELWVSRGVAALCKRLEWQHVAIVYEDNLWGRESKQGCAARRLASRIAQR